MLKTKYDVLVRNGKDRFVVVPVKDYQAMHELIEDEIDFRTIKASKKENANAPVYTLDQIKQLLGIASPKRKRKSWCPPAQHAAGFTPRDFHRWIDDENRMTVRLPAPARPRANALHTLATHLQLS
jgi:hypothetical protein